ncbi:hypothetical protein HanLR1_Chr15g0562191 [Helianthus annuus]|nr:hypothetical protein HanLR1_Chr15g0562191 [Helianthus annuus]
MPAWWSKKSTKNKDQDKILKHNSINSNPKDSLKKHNRSLDDVLPSGFSGFGSDRTGYVLPQPVTSPTTSFGLTDLHGSGPGSGSVSSSGDSSVSSSDYVQFGIVRFLALLLAVYLLFIDFPNYNSHLLLEKEVDLCSDTLYRHH